MHIKNKGVFGRLAQITPLLALSVPILLLTAGCGGGRGPFGSNAVTVNTGGTGSDSQSLNSVALTPTPGTVGIGTQTTFLATWGTTGLPTPRAFKVGIAHYKEPHDDGDAYALDSESITVTQTDKNTWAIQRTNAVDLLGGGVYVVGFNLPGTRPTTYYAYIAAYSRSFPVSDQTRSASASPGTGGSLDGIQLSPAPGSTFIAKGTKFQLSWKSPAVPPSQFQVALWRYKERRDGDLGGVTEQQVSLSRQGGSNVWSFKRSSGNLDDAGTYYVEITDQTTGGTYRAAYIAANDDANNNDDSDDSFPVDSP